MPPTALDALIRESKQRRGKWRLTPDHEIEYRGEGLEEEFSIKGPLVSAEPGAVLFAVTEKVSDKKTVTRLAKLSGEWSVNSRQQIIFSISKEFGRNDVLTFGSGWRLNDRYELVYTYRQTALKTRRRLDRELVFAGAWDFSGKNQISFLIGGDDRSRLRFRGAFQTPSILAKKGEIRYQLGAEASAGRLARTLVFFGKWKISRRYELSFELQTRGASKKALQIGGQWNFDGSEKVTAHLLSSDGEPLGAELLFSKTIFKNGQFFAGLEHSADGIRFEAGARWAS